MDKCEICEEWGLGMMLMGGFPVVLCIQHRRQWHEVCDDSAELDALCSIRAESIEAQLRITGQPDAADSLPELERICREKEKLMYGFAKRWLAEQQAAHKKGAEDGIN